MQGVMESLIKRLAFYSQLGKTQYSFLPLQVPSTHDSNAIDDSAGVNTEFPTGPTKPLQIFYEFVGFFTLQSPFSHFSRREWRERRESNLIKMAAVLLFLYSEMLWLPRK